jgi:uncharacterized protein YkwD
VAESQAAPTVSTLLAPVNACPGSESAEGSLAERNRGLVCLVNYARKRARLSALRRSSLLSRAAGRKGRDLAGCGEFSHTPCGARATAATTAAGYRFRSWAENLFWGTGELATAREAMRRWLLSPPHRANLLAQNAREVGVALLSVPSYQGHTAVSLWVLQVARPA